VVPLALLRLGYTAQEAAEIVNHIDLHGTIEGAPHLKHDHLPVFDCSLKPANGRRSIHYMGHIRMMAAVQPFISGAISKTVNLPEEAMPDDIMDAYIESWRLGLKAMAVYRDGSKRSQPLNTASKKSDARSSNDSVAPAQDSGPAGQKSETRGQNGTEPRIAEGASVPSPELWRLGANAAAGGRDGSKRPQTANAPSGKKEVSALKGQTVEGGKKAAAVNPEASTESSIANVETRETTAETPVPAEPRPFRKKLPDERRAYTHKFSVGGHEGYLTVGLYENGQPGEIFITMAKEGSTVSGLMDSIATAISLALQYGVPLKVLCDKFSHTRFEPSGWSRNPEIGYAKSLMDYIFRWLALKFLPRDAQPQESTSVVTPNGADVTTAAHLASQFSEAAAGQNPSAASADPPVQVTGMHSQQAQLAGVVHEDDAPSCSDCGAIMVRNGACFRCMNCGSTSGCS